MIKNEGKGKEIFFGVVALATLIVAIIGATLAYFSITASSNEGAINATAAVVSIEYNDGQQVTAQADQLIPAEPSIVQKVYETRFKDATVQEDLSEVGNICIDSNGKQVCSVYRFTIKSDTERDITAMLYNEHNGFSYLSYAVYKVGNDTTEGSWMKLSDDDRDGEISFLGLNNCSNANNEGDNANTEDDCFEQDGLKKTYAARAKNSIFGKTFDEETGESLFKSETISGTTQVYDLVLFLKETNENQNIDQGKQYLGTISVEVLEGESGGNVSGFIDEDDPTFQQ